MKISISVVACLIAAALPATSSAQVYQWKDSSGRTVISDTPPPPNAKGSRSIGSNPPPSTTTPATEGAAAAPKATAEKEMDFKKRQQEAKEKADKEAKEKAAAAENKENCERARRQLTALESGVRVAMADEKGERRFMEDAERQREIERTRKAVAETCK